MHILIGAKSIFESGGMQRVTTELANNLSRRGHKITIIGEANNSLNIYYPLDREVALINIRPYYRKYNIKYLPQKIAYKILWHLKKYTPTISDTSSFQKLKWASEHNDCIDTWRNLCLTLNPDIILGVLPDSFTILSLALQGTHLPLVINNHSNPWRDYSTERYDPNPVDVSHRNLAPQLAAANTVLLPEYKDFFSEEVQRCTYVIPNVVGQIPSEKRAKPGISNGIKTIIAAGRLVEVKGHKTLIEAFSLLNEDFPDWQVKIFGEGFLRNNLNRLIEDLQLTKSVFLCDYSHDIFKEYQASHILAMPSYFEGFGLAVTEAMAHGLPCVGFDDASGVNGLIKHGETGYLANGSNRVKSFAYYLGKLMANASIREDMGKSGIEFVKQFEPDRVYDLWEKNLKEIVQKHSKSRNS